MNCSHILNKKNLWRPVISLLVFCLSFTSGGAQARFSKLDEWMEMNAEAIGGRAILVIYKDGDIIYNKSVNRMTRRQKSIYKYIQKKLGGDPGTYDYTLNTRQHVASCSKWLSAAVVMSFVDEGKLRLSDTVGTWLPVLSAHGKGNITISECLSHLTGIKEPPLNESLKRMKKIRNMDQAIGEIADMPMEGEPGKVFHYSNAGLQIAAAVVEKIGEKSFEDLFADRIATPLGLKNTDFGKKQVAFPAGGASSTPDDYLLFLSMILHKGSFNGKQIISEESVREMETNRIGPDVRIAYSPTEAKGFGYGFGEWLVKNTEESQSGGWVTSPGLFGSFPWIENDKQYGAFLMTFYLNNKDRNELYLGLKNLVDEAVQNN
jgi:CubicO group peptidase (beta-lactamase class C family)